MNRIYKVWVRVTVEEYDPVEDDFRNVVEYEDRLVEDRDPDEYGSVEFDQYESARQLADSISNNLNDLFGDFNADD